MLKNLLLTIGLILTSAVLVFSQTGTLKGRIIDAETKEPIPFANVVIEVGGAQKGGASTDFDGYYTIKPINPGTYTVKALYVGYQPKQINGVTVIGDKIRFLDFAMNSSMTELEVFEVVDYEVPLISKDQTSSGGTVTSEEIAKMPNKNVTAIATTVGGVYTADGGAMNIRGQRSSGTVTYIDGIRVTGSTAIPESAIDQVSVILGGVPAQYGDAVGGIVSVTTKGPSRKFGAGLELQTSQFLDAFGYNRASVNMNGPLLKSKDPNDPTALLGYFLAGEFIYREDNYPNAVGSYKLNDADLKDMEDNPLRFGDDLSIFSGIAPKAAFVHKDQLEHMNSAIGNSTMDINLSGKIDVRTGPSVNLTFGGSYNRNEFNPYSFSNQLFNYNSLRLIQNEDYRVFGRLSQRFSTDEESSSVIKNIYYTIQADYSHIYRSQQHNVHGDELLRYGHVGQFDSYMEKSYDNELGIDEASGKAGYLMTGWGNTGYDFTRSEYNPILANYTGQAIQLLENNPNYVNILQSNPLIYKEDLIPFQGLLNGMQPGGIFSTDILQGGWGLPGDYQSGYNYTKYNADQIGINIKASADVGNHAMTFGFIFEQRTEKGYGYKATELWTLMRQMTNSHITQLDMANGEEVIIDGETFFDYPRLVAGSTQTRFDKMLRAGLGLEEFGAEWIDVDSYNMETNEISYYTEAGDRVTRSLDTPITVDMFSADELMNNTTAYSFGYDMYGNALDYKPTIEDFISATDDMGFNTRHRDAVRPVYVAGYIQDQFAFKDLIFNIGVRVDRFDANQPTLNDPYLLYKAKTASEVVSEFGPQPENISDDAVVYVDDFTLEMPTLAGYREGDKWYNTEGIEIMGDPNSQLDLGNGINPYLVDKTPEMKADAFKDYDPQYSIMPRVAFSFPISDEALFFAHYDVLTQRPVEGETFNASSMYLWPVRGTSVYNPTTNPNLRPEQTIDYELGFQQKLSNTSSMTIAAFYREVRDQIQVFRYSGAYPKQYYSYNNIDFGTVKGLTLTYDLRRTKNVRVKASYTLQFAKGTGSDATTQAGLINAGLPNLRTIFPLSHDQRHRFNLMFDYRFDEGKKYTGPTSTRKIKGTDQVKTINWLENTGLNITLYGGTGTPYTKSSRVGVMEIEGAQNGARKPASFRFDARVDRDFMLSSGTGDDARQTYLNVYVQVLNVLNTKNVMDVYAATGVADDDGYLDAPEWQSTINANLDPQAFRDLYRIALMHPGNYSTPRQIRVGLSLNF
ncbi:MAG: carboxypeptidase-like regulatory domain-containing protein [Bacteroidales bacterium]|nr:carboxypeptidase-like regulatory domain-containing protein [Bacteroidales bacterium]